MENNLEVIENKTVEIKQRTIALVARATKFQITDSTSLQKSTGMLSDVVGLKKDSEAVRKIFTTPHNEELKIINSFFKKLVMPLDKATLILKGKAKDYYLAKEEKAKEAEKERLMAEIKREEEIRKAEEENREPVVEEIPAVPEVKTPEKTVRGVAGGSMTFRKHWKHEIIDLEKVPHEFWEVNESLIRDAVNKGMREIPGCRIYEDIDTSVRR